MFMLTLTVQQLGDTSVLCCKGRIVIGGAYSSLRNAVLSQTGARMVFLDMAQVDRVDAGGLGVLLALREWTRSRAIRFKLMNVKKNVDQLLELTNLQRAFEFCSIPEMFCLLHRAASIPSWRPDQKIQSACTCSGKRLKLRCNGLFGQVDAGCGWEKCGHILA
jgi:anti-anti-sigma factor